MKKILPNKKAFGFFLHYIIIGSIFSFYYVQCMRTSIHPEPYLIKGYLQQIPYNGRLFLSIGYHLSTPDGRSFTTSQRLSYQHPLYDIAQILFHFRHISDTCKIEFLCPHQINPNTIFEESHYLQTNIRLLDIVQSRFYENFLKEHRSFLIKQGFIPAPNSLTKLFKYCF